MATDADTSFVPILTVMADYGNAPFLWLADSPDVRGVGPNVCDGSRRDESYLMSEGLWRKFADWAIPFDRTHFYYGSEVEHCETNGWDWIAFHERGIQLSRWLKEEVGDAYRVAYQKPYEDPNHGIEMRREILKDSSLEPLSWPRRVEARGLVVHVVSGGQTGADRAALDFAMKHGYTHGGWAPHGRKAEDGPIPARYQLVELPIGGYRQRTRQNVHDSDGTLILNLGKLDGGTLTTQAFAKRAGKPCLVVQLDSGVTDEIAAIVLAWLREHAIRTLNVAGPREGRRPGTYRLTFQLLEAVDAKAN